jgi:hypothetical protein
MVVRYGYGAEQIREATLGGTRSGDEPGGAQGVPVIVGRSLV